MADFNVCDTNHQGVSDKVSTTQFDGGSAIGCVNTATDNNGKAIFANQLYHNNGNSTAAPTLHEGTETKPLRSAINSNTVDLMEAFSVCDAADTKHFKTCQNSATKHHGGSTMKRSATSTTNHNNYKIKVANQDYHRDSVTASTANDLEIPVVEQEVLRKDWASLTDQNFYEGILPDSQKIALVAIIDYVKRKGVALGSDSEIYRWLYHTVSHHECYYSRAVNFKHLANILMKQLINRRFERPSGFNAWEESINQKGSKMSHLQRE